MLTMSLDIEKILFTLEEINAPIPKITTAGLRALGPDDKKADMYLLTDDGKKGTYWKKRGKGLASEDNRGTILVTTDLIVYENQYKGSANVKWFGAKGDNLTDDSVAIKSALTLIDKSQANGVFFPNGNYKISSAVQTVITGKSNFSILMNKSAKIINDDFTDFNNASASFDGKTATITTDLPHKFADKSGIVMTDFTDPAYNGMFAINVINPNTFTYELVFVPAGNARGKVRINDFSKTFLTLDNCNNANIDLTFEGTKQHIAVQQRLGWIAINLQNGCSKIKLNLKCSGLSHGVHSGDWLKDTGNLSDSDITIDATNVGYPIALWKSGIRCTFNIKAFEVHRSAYVGAAENSTFNIITKNFDITGILVTLHYIGTTVWGCNNLVINIKDVGSDLSTPKPRNAQLVAILGYDVAGPVEVKNLDITIECINAKYVIPLLIRTYSPLHKISNITIRGTIDRTKLTNDEISNEMIIGGEGDAAKSGTYSGIKFLSWRVFNPTKGTTKLISIQVSKLSDDITFNDFMSNSPRMVKLPRDKKLLLPTQRIYTDSTTKVITEQMLNKKYPIKSYPVGTTVFYYLLNKKFERKTATKWESTTSATLD
jgi:hypothetical protein